MTITHMRGFDTDNTDTYVALPFKVTADFYKSPISTLSNSDFYTEIVFLGFV
jgi:hypothetical protein